MIVNTMNERFVKPIKSKKDQKETNSWTPN